MQLCSKSHLCRKLVQIKCLKGAGTKMQKYSGTAASRGAI